MFRKVLNDQRELPSFIHSIVQWQKSSSPPPNPHVTFPPVEKCLSCPTRKPDLGSLGCHFLLNYAGRKKKIKCPFVPWKAIADPIVLFSPAYVIYTLAFSEIHPLQICFVFGRKHLQL